MREFFKGWRRKVGCVALVIACVCAGGWSRSSFVGDRLEYEIGVRQYRLLSLRGRIVWGAANPDVVSGRLDWQAWELSRRISVGIPEYGWDPEDRWKIRRWELPYWAITLPLTLLSAYLILWKPRPKDTPDA